ncbi:hypothetical protein K504DRAFT_350741, partial [Pleomassaria siparia CBS 279.74]
GHKRSLSGSILGSLQFLRSSSKNPTPASPPERGADEADNDGESSKQRGLSITTALRQSQGRKRKGSLRKTAILGKRRNSILNRTPAKPSIITTSMDIPPPSPSPDGDGDGDDETTPRRFSYENPSLNSSSDSGWLPAGRLSVSTASSGYSHDGPEHSTPRPLASSTLISPVGPYASTTDDDDAQSFFRPSASISSASYNSAQQPLGSAASLQRRRSNRSGPHSSLTVVHTPADVALDDEWDYSETEWWGWVVLIVTWVVFVVGMGSCLGIWSWAWDVGETPYAPPELEDDPTLPITGYYPALMVCTAVMAWVWVVVAWVGMKYFRHAKV